MPRLSIEISARQHQLIKANAALQGKSLKYFVLERALQDGTGAQNEASALEPLNAALAPALELARNGQFSGQTVQDIMRDEKAR